MKKLILLRHAKTLSPDHGQDDLARNLAPAGIADAAAFGAEIKRKYHKPDLILCSPSQRTQQTMTGLLQAFDNDNEQIDTQIIDSIYDATRGDLLNAIQSADNKYGTIMVIGHNPGIYELSVTLAVQGSDHLMNKLARGFKPSTASVLECPCREWNFFQPGDNTLIDLLEPIDYNAPASPTRWT